MAAIDRLNELDAVARLRARDASLYSDDPAVQADVTNRLGWTDLAAEATDVRPLVDQLTAQVAESLTDVVLLGMGGSSLASLVIGSVLSEASARLHVLDTVSPVTVGSVLDAVVPATTIALVSSKSGGTIEPNALYAVFRAHFDSALGREAAGARFVAITDPGSSLEELAVRDGFRATIPAPPTVGGRFSALTTFGLVPAALIGADLDRLLESGRTMEQACAETTDIAENPAVELATFIADSRDAGRDKLTIVASRRFAKFGLWVEQLVAESLGKHGTGVVPIVELATGTPSGYGSDRAVVVLRENGDERLAQWAQAQRGALPIHEILVGDEYGIGGEFVRWEYAVALCGVLLGVNPFDEPNVAEAKAATAAVLEGGAAPIAMQVRFDDETEVTFAGALDQPDHHEHTLATALGHAIAALDDGDYLAILAYLPDDEALQRPLREAIPKMAAATGAAVALETGPRYLHSTGQLHKGGPNTGVFIVVSNDDAADIPVPGKSWGLKALHRAQADGDLATLTAHERRAIRVDLPDASADTVERFAGALLDAAGVVREAIAADYEK